MKKSNPGINVLFQSFDVSLQLFKLGYKNIDGLDFSPKMLDVAYAKGVLKNTIEDTIDGKHKTNIPNGTYNWSQNHHRPMIEDDNTPNGVRRNHATALVFDPKNVGKDIQNYPNC